MRQIETTLPWTQTCQAGAVYFAIAFAAGFALGPVRMLVLEPRVGKLAAVLIEHPVILLVSLIAARWVVSRWAKWAGLLQRLAIGLIALLLLLSAECGLGAMMGLSPMQWIASWSTPAGAAGLAGQLLFALLPAIAGEKFNRAAVA
jgi:hypothetical protein